MENNNGNKKGTVTSLSSLFPPEEAERASRRVHDAINERVQQLNQLRDFIDDNVNLINLVNKLPDETHHNIMVPFGKAAFFPGRLIHTNEFMVLLGEGYYAERTSKQTTEILKRRGVALEKQVESLKAIMQDLKAEASFFDTTAQESAEGLVEIREDYVEVGSSETSTTAGYVNSDSSHLLEVDDKKAASEDDEYARIFSRMSELEKEEEEAEKANESDEEKQTIDALDKGISQISVNQEVRNSPPQVEAPKMPAVSKGGPSHGNYPVPDRSTVNKASEPSEDKKKVQAQTTATNKAFTGSIVEHAHNIGANLPEQQTGARSSKPVSRFKMQRK